MMMNEGKKLNNSRGQAELFGPVFGAEAAPGFDT
jgi:hypothetical protein